MPRTLQDPSAGSTCLVAGWGRTTRKDQKMSDVLMSVNVTVIDRVKCNSPEYYNSKPIITGNMICAGSVDKNIVDTCQVTHQRIVSIQLFNHWLFFIVIVDPNMTRVQNVKIFSLCEPFCDAFTSGEIAKTFANRKTTEMLVYTDKQYNT